ANASSLNDGAVAAVAANRRAANLPAQVVEKAQFETSPYEMNENPDLPPAPTQEHEPAPEPEAPSAPRTPIKDRPSKKKTATAETQIQDEDSVAKTPQPDEAKKEEQAVVKPKDTVADMPTAKKKEESAKKKSKKEPAARQPNTPELNEKEKADARRVRSAYKSDVLSDYE
ncbi:hypothetical protein PENTCL1PPCAC_4557, partial [Pristionchus entomophagus]